MQRWHGADRAGHGWRRNAMKRLAAALAAAVLAVLALVAGALYASLPVLDGERAVPGLQAEISIARDALGVVTIRGRSRLDVARATGFVHAQDRLFQMDLLRRDAAGELAALVGRAALRHDRSRRLHRLRAVAERVVARADPARRALLQAYADGVNAGIASLRVRPPEYLLLGVAPQPWRAADTVLVVHAMFLVLNGEQLEQAVQIAVAHDALPGEWFEYLNQPGTDWDAPLVGAAVQPLAVPGPQACDLRETGARSARVRVREDEAGASIGSNAWAVAAAPGAGGALVADDMHLGLRLPNIWYRMRLIVEESGAAAGSDVTGAVLPGAPVVVVGSNRHIAWGFTNSNGDWLDLVDVETDAADPGRYRTAQGWRRFEIHDELIQVKDAPPQQVQVRSTIWGPLIDAPGPLRALRWIAHLPEAVNIDLIDLERAGSVDDALAIAPRLGIPPQNLVVGDRSGRIAWTIAGRIPARDGYDPRLPASWADGRTGWQGWLSPDRYPAVVDPPHGRIWTANARLVDGAWLQRLGDGGYAHGARARQIRDRLLALDAPDVHDMLAIQLDDRALFMQRWRQVLLAALSADAIREHPRLQQMRALVVHWHGRASIDAVGYRLVKAFRSRLHDDLIAHIASACGRFPDGFEYRPTRQSDGALWRIVAQRPAHLLPAPHASWDAYLLDAAMHATAQCGGGALAACTWGEHNTVRVAHPLSRALPVLGPLLDIAPAPMPGDAWLPRVQRGLQGASQRFAVSPGREEQGYFHMPGGQSGHPLSRWYRAGHDAWLHGEPLPFLPGEARHWLTLRPPAGG